MGTIYTGKVKNHSIRIDNTLTKCKLFIDGTEKDVINGRRITSNNNTLRTFITEEDREIPVEVVLDAVLIENGSWHNVYGLRFIVKIDGEYFDSGFMKPGQQKKYGNFMNMTINAVKNDKKE